MRNVLAGARFLARGFGFWRTDSGAMLLGLVPAVIVFVAAVWALVAWSFALPGIVAWATPFAEGWSDAWRDLLRLAIGLVVFGGSAVLLALTYTAITLAVGDPFYERIWKTVERHVGGEPPEGSGFWRAVRDGAGLVVLGLGAGIASGLAGLVPVVGAIAGPVLGVVLGGTLLARELTSRVFEARGIHGDERRALIRPHRARLLGFGVVTQLCFLVPLGAVVTMPAAVAGATLLGRSILDGAAAPDAAEAAASADPAP